MSQDPLGEFYETVAPHLGFTADRFERFIAWAHYLHWADLHMRRYLAWEKPKHQSDEMRADWELIALMSTWYASLWVVVEGWREIPLSDPSVDKLIASNEQYVDLLRRFRNSAFHYQPRIGDKKVMELLAEGEPAVHWICLLHHEFCRFYRELVERAPLPPALASEIRDCMLDLVGWLPSGSRSKDATLH